MSAPNTNIEKQKKNHRPALIGIAAVVIFAGIVFLFNLDAAVDSEGLVEDDAQMIEGAAPD